MDSKMLTYKLLNKALRINTFGLINDIDQKEDTFFKIQIEEMISNRISSFYNGLNNDGIIRFSEHDHDGMFYFKDVRLKMDNPVYLFFRLICMSKLYVLLNFFVNCPWKIWINNKLVAMHKDFFDSFLITDLNEGSNIIVLELTEYSENTRLSLRVNDYDKEMEPRFDAILYKNYKTYNNKIAVVSKNNFISNEGIYEFILIPFNTKAISKDQKIAVKVVDEQQSNVLDEFFCYFYECVKYDTKKIKSCYNKLSNILTFIFEFEKSEELRTYVCLSEEKSFITNLKSEAIDLINKGLVDEIGTMHLRKTIENITIIECSNKHKINKWNVVLELYNVIGAIKMGYYYENYVLKKGCTCRFYISAIDNSIVSYNLFVPQDYNKDREYPLVLIVGNDHFDKESYNFKFYNGESVIFADISGRGITTGSYIGEVSIMETLEDIKKTFSINENRIYIMGYSNGAYAAWALTQAYPHYFAGTLLISGVPRDGLLTNLYNVKTINISSKTEHLYKSAYKDPLKKLIEINDFTGILYDKLLHVDLAMILNKWDIIEILLKGIREQFPQKVIYRTERNRHRKAYWIEIHSIEYGKNYAKISAEIVGNDIVINAVHTSGFTLTIPPQINRKKFNVIINNSYSFTFSRYNDSHIHFYKIKKAYVIKKESLPPLKSRKGTGLIDIYLKPMSIIVSTTTDEVIMKVAKVFAHPSTKGFNSAIYVDYPIITANEVNNNILANNLILIGTSDDNLYINSIKHLLHVKMTYDGFEYKSKFYHGECCIMQVVPNPYNLDSTILIIQANNKDLFRRNLFTRKVMLPGYVSGFHPFLNSEALIFYNNHYYSVYEWNSDIVEIKDKQPL
jgi:hypothetical protein